MIALRGQCQGGPIAGKGRIVPVLCLALPAVGEQLLNMMVGLVDTYMVGHLGAASIAAVSISNQVVMLALVLFAAVATGATVFVAHCIGARDLHAASSAVGQSLLVGAPVGLATGIAGMVFAPQAARIMGAADDSLPLAAAYLRIVSASLPLATCMFIGTACLRGAGDTMSTVRVMMLVNVVNMGVAASLIHGSFGLPKLGVVGSAVGAACARSLGGIVILTVLWRGRAGLRLNPGTLAPDWALIRRVLSIGIPTGLEQLAFRGADMLYFRVVASLGTAACAAHAVSLNIESLSYSPGFGFGVAATALVGQGLGGSDPKRGESDGWLSFALGGGVMSLMGLMFVAFPQQFLRVMTNDPEVIRLGVGPLRLVGFAQPFLASAIILAGALRGAGDTRFPMLSNGLNSLVTRFGLAVLFVNVLHLGLMGAWYALFLDITARGVLCLVRFRSGAWRRGKVR